MIPYRWLYCERNNNTNNLMRRSATLGIGLTVLLTVSASSFADYGDFFPTYNQSPLVQIFGLPSLQSARLLHPGQTQIELTYEAASNYIVRNSGTESLTLDGETHRTALSIHHGTGNAEWGIEIPYLTQSGGFMDSFIDSWHDTFGLPDGGRKLAPRNQLLYLYQRNGIDVLRLIQPSSGIGDVRLQGAWSLGRSNGPIDAAIRASLKLPTGDSAGLTGSDSTDLAVWVNAACATPACPRDIQWTLAGGLLSLGSGKVLPDQQRRWVGFGGAGISWKVWQPLALKAQLLGHTAFYQDSELKPLNQNAVQLLLGGTWDISSRTALDIAISEDLNVNTAPDVSALISLRTRF